VITPGTQPSPVEAEPPLAESAISRNPASYRDPSGFVFRRDEVLLRQINGSYADEWQALSADGFLARLQAAGMLVRHEQEPISSAASADAVAVIRPDAVEFVSYPYEWSFSQLKAAALLTLDVQRMALSSGFTLKDASAYNVQFHQGSPILIDTLSFERVDFGAAWVAYRQFCEHFLAPLALMAYRDIRFGAMLREHLEGIPLDFASALLPRRTWLRLGIASHVHFHARAQGRYSRAGNDASTGQATRSTRMNEVKHLALVDSLQRTVRGLDWAPVGTEWADYADQTSYGAPATQRKDELVRDLLQQAGEGVVWDLGANTGRFSRIAAELGSRVVAWDIDPAATERHVRALDGQLGKRVLPLLLDLANPSPDLGWGGEERQSIFRRADANVILALALVHHLAIGRNVPLPMIAETMSRLGKWLIIEFVPREDQMVQVLLSTRKDVFGSYHLSGFRDAFDPLWETVTERPIEGTARTLHLLRRRS
jgi:SAM-dependent methyltransferase